LPCSALMGSPRPAHDTEAYLTHVRVQMIVNQLRSAGATQCNSVDNGLEAMRAVRRHNYTHVVLDLCLPLIDGFSLIFEILDTCLVMNKPVPAICIVTAQDGLEVDVRCTDAGAQAVFHKPVSRESLCAFIDAHMAEGGAGSHSPTGGRSVGLMNLLRGTGGANLDCIDQAKRVQEWSSSRPSFDSSSVHEAFETI